MNADHDSIVNLLYIQSLKVLIASYDDCNLIVHYLKELKFDKE